MSSASPVIVIVGGSFAGVKIAKALDVSLKTKATIILIEEKEALFFTVAALRAVTEPGLAEQIWIPYTSLFQNNPANKVIQSRVTDVSEKQVTLINGETVAFDYLVICTGSKVPSPAKTEKLTKAEGVAEMKEITEALKTAKSAVIVGGGVVGVELAGEIATDYPTVKVTIIHSGAELMNRNLVKPKFTQTLMGQLAKLNVDVKLNQRVVPSEPGAPILPSGSFTLSKLTLKTSTGDSVESDIQFLCTGITGPNSGFVKSLGADVLNAEGYIQTEPTGQVKGFKHIFAAGDVSTLDAAKLVYTAGTQAPIVSGNIAALVSGSNAPLKLYKPFVLGSIAMATVGRKGGVFQSPLGTFGPFTTGMIKGKSLFLPAWYAELNQKSTYVPPK
ncbi:hypothetical protein HDU98_005783 [Podochytrium sp. JEL0797]|nr:hypothetical protein HDU98_005783 [Podochytrium sp. JEL0797]